MNAPRIINAYGAPAVCRAVGDYIVGGPWDTVVPELDECEFMGEVLAVMTIAHTSLSQIEQAKHARTLSELADLSRIEEALILNGRLANTDREHD